VRLDQVAVLAGDPVAFDDLGHAAHELGDLVDLAGRRPDADDGAQRVAEGRGVDGGVVALDHARALETLEPLGDRRRREADAPAELGDGQTSVGLELDEQAAVRVVEGGRFGNQAETPLIHRRKC